MVHEQTLFEVAEEWMKNKALVKQQFEEKNELKPSLDSQIKTVVDSNLEGSSA